MYSLTTRYRFLVGLVAAGMTWQPPSAWSDTPLPIRLVVFDFELEDFSAGANVTAGSAEDATELSKASDEVRSLIARSGRYRLIDASHALDPAVRSHTLRGCNGCDAAIAARLGADQSMTGIVSRISRTEYQVTYTLRDAKGGAIISVKQTDLRIGADYSWNRGAAWLIKNKLLTP